MNLAHTVTIAISLSVTVFVVQIAISLIAGDIASGPRWAVIAGNTLASTALFTISVKVIAAGFSRFDWLLKFVLREYYLRGTWGGRIKTPSGRILIVVEHYKQDTLGLVIQGWSFEPEGSIPDAWWVTKCVEIDPKQGQLVCLYETHVPRRDGSEEVRYGTGRFVVNERESSLGPPVCMAGIAVDEFHQQGLVYEVARKLSPKLLALEEARKRVLLELMPEAEPSGPADPPGQSVSGDA